MPRVTLKTSNCCVLFSLQNSRSTLLLLILETWVRISLWDGQHVHADSRTKSTQRRMQENKNSPVLVLRCALLLGVPNYTLICAPECCSSAQALINHVNRAPCKPERHWANDIIHSKTLLGRFESVYAHGDLLLPSVKKSASYMSSQKPKRAPVVSVRLHCTSV